MMNLIFMNSLEKKTDESVVSKAQVSISEHQGSWMVVWHEPKEDGRGKQQVWYEGNAWNDMLSQFRTRLRDQIDQGFVPLIDDGRVNRRQSASARATAILHCYSERHANAELFAKLRDWRREQAAKEAKAPFIIAGNRLLYMIASFFPHTEEELLQLPGFGGNRLKLYGEAILAITGTFDRNTGFPLDWVEGAVEQKQLDEWLDRQQELKDQQDEQKRQTRRKLLEGIDQGATLDVLVEKTSLSRMDLVAAIEQLDKDGYDVELLVDRELKMMPENEKMEAELLFAELGDRFLKPVLQRLYSPERLNEAGTGVLYERLRFIRLKLRKEKAAVRA
ncbi:HRDC domain-containing protein [Paenibacillus sp. MBLB4367]|uniref:HRDC domain-containing protein n=1 Tax=Paenibacillus sp. MBLB4367 TaxID=3384767 RepID=UPI003908074C